MLVAMRCYLRDKIHAKLRDFPSMGVVPPPPPQFVQDSRGEPDYKKEGEKDPETVVELYKLCITIVIPGTSSDLIYSYDLRINITPDIIEVTWEVRLRVALTML